MERHSVVEAGLAVAVHVIRSTRGHLAGIACAILPCGLARAVVDGGREAVLHIARVRVGDGQAVAGEEGVDESLIDTQSVTATILTHGCRAEESVAIAVALRDGECNLVIALAPALDVHVVGREERIGLAVRSHLHVECVAGALSLVDAELAGLHSLVPLLRVVGGVEDLLALVVLVFGVPGIAVHQRAGGKEQHARTHGERHDAVHTAILRRVVVDGGQRHSSLEHLLVAVVDDVVELRLADHQLREREVGRSDVVGLKGNATVVLGHLPPGIGAEELHLVLHIVNFRLRQIVVGHCLYHIAEDVAVTDVARHHVPEVTTPCGVDGPLTENLRDDTVPVPLLPAGGGSDIVGEHLIAVGGECPLVGVVYDVVDVAQPRIHLVAVLEHHLCGELGVGFLVQIVGAGGKQPSPNPSQGEESQDSTEPHK